jgi:hypothetical protein
MSLAGIALAVVSNLAFGLTIPGIIILRGDANNDGTVNGSDPIFINQYLFNGGSAPPCKDAADVNDDGVIDISDSSHLNSYLFMGGPPPAAPFPNCGKDPTPDNLGCGMSACP